MNMTYLCDVLWCNRQKIDFVGEIFGRLYCGNVRVDQHNLDALFF